MTKPAALLLLFATAAAGAGLQPVPNFSIPPQAPVIRSRCVPREPWTVAGEHGALFGRQNGEFEAWLWPVKILSDFKISAELANYAVPIDVNALAAEIQVTPAETIITYSHAAFTIRQHMFAARGAAAPATGVVAYFEVESARPIEITFSFLPQMLRMWPAPNFGRPSGEWVANGGFYILHTDNPNFSGLVAMPNTQPGIMVPYQEHPQTFPLQFKLSYDPKRDRGMVYPLIMALAGSGAAADQVAAINTAIPKLYRQTHDYYAHFFDNRVIAATPDPRIDEALRWAEVAVDQMQVQYHNEVGLVAGYYESADSARPGYAWFFGRDTLWSTYAVNSYGDFALTRRALDFLIRRQRADGKIMHEYSQSAADVDWKATPYFYASADSTPLLVMAMADYVKASGDTGYLRANWQAVRKAYEFTRAHEGNDGIYNNKEGTGWVESWPPTMPQEEIYLAALDQQSNQAISMLAGLIGDSALSANARTKAAAIAAKIESEYYEPSQKFYAFSRNSDGSVDHTATIYPSVAWWDGTFALKQPGEMLARWASAEFSADWGTRDVSKQTSFYDPISYHQGSIWPLFTGWVSLAEYRAARPLSAYAHLMQNLNLTWAQDLGSVTELLSGEFYQPLGRSSSHQMWSSAMIITPLLRGLFGLDWDAAKHTLHITPHLPADWGRASLKHVHVGPALVDLEYKRTGGVWNIRASSPSPVCIAPANTDTCAQEITVRNPSVEIAIPAVLPLPGSKTQQLKALSEEWTGNHADFTFAAQGGTAYDLPLRLNRANPRIVGAELHGSRLHLQFPNGNGYQELHVTFDWP
ncbi:MAG TPA: glycogen debranching protein, partial [Acidobacteriaceae bacterium]|nr:glycogen debranching protein [Acidobacteriaceae bacterium]